MPDEGMYARLAARVGVDCSGPLLQSVCMHTGVRHELHGAIVPQFGHAIVLRAGDFELATEVLKTEALDRDLGLRRVVTAVHHFEVALRVRVGRFEVVRVVDARREDANLLPFGQPLLHALDHRLDRGADIGCPLPPVVFNQRAIETDADPSFATHNIPLPVEKRCKNRWADFVLPF
jgi:hypothetical protein